MGDTSGTDSHDSRIDDVDDSDDTGVGEGEGNAIDEVDEWGRESFPASDPPNAWSGPPDT